MNKIIQENILNSFLSRVNKLTVGRSTSDKFYGRVTLKSSADYSRGHNSYLGRFGYGTRKFTVAKSNMIPNGTYTLGKLRAKLQDAIAYTA